MAEEGKGGFVPGGRRKMKSVSQSHQQCIAVSEDFILYDEIASP